MRWMDGWREGGPTGRQGVHNHNTFFLRAACPTSDCRKNLCLPRHHFKICDWPSMKQEITFKWCGFSSHINLLRPKRPRKSGEATNAFYCSITIHFHFVSGTHNFFVVRVPNHLAVSYGAHCCCLRLFWWTDEVREGGRRNKRGKWNEYLPLRVFGRNFPPSVFINLRQLAIIYTTLPSIQRNPLTSQNGPRGRRLRRLPPRSLRLSFVSLVGVVIMSPILWSGWNYFPLLNSTVQLNDRP